MTVDISLPLTALHVVEIVSVINEIEYSEFTKAI